MNILKRYISKYIDLDINTISRHLIFIFPSKMAGSRDAHTSGRSATPLIYWIYN
jgi:hypothetical protein